MSGQKQKREQILIMNNSAAQRKALSNMLSDKYDIIEAESGDGVLKLLKERSYDIDLVLLEINETGTDEFKLLSLIKNYRWIDDTPVVMISPEVSHEYIQKAYDDGVVDYIRRPYDSFEVHKRLANILLLYRKQKRLLGALEEQVYDNEKNNRMMINVLAHIVEFRNGESGMHVHHIRTLTAILLQRLVEKTDKYHLTENDMLLISTASSFHDIGKISIDDKILNKPGRLTAEEFEIMKSHSVIGADMLTELYKKKNYPLIDKAYEICRWHHERYDGKGYPDGLVGDNIPISAQVTAISDVYDALTSDRCYKKAYSHEKAMEMILDGQCGAFNPLLLECLKDCEVQILSEIGRTDHDSLGDRLLIRATEELVENKVFSGQGSNPLQRSIDGMERWNFLSEGSYEIQFEYDAVLDVLRLTDYAAQKLGLSKVIMHPRGVKQEYIGKSNIDKIEKMAKEQTSSDKSRFEIKTKLVMNGEERRYCIKIKTLWSSDEHPKYIGLLGRIIDTNDEETLVVRPQYRLKEGEDTEIRDTIRCLTNVFDVVRLVDMNDNEVVRVGCKEGSEDMADACRGHKCYAVWGKSQRCKNCVSSKAFEKHGQMSKLEFADDSIYQIISKYVEVSGKPYALEMIYKDKDGVLLGAYGKSDFMDNIVNYNRQLYHDALTGAYNRRYYEEQAKSMRYIEAVAMLDANNFKSINDRYGHAAGDLVLKAICDSIRKCIRSTDVLVRLGGDEFVLLMTNIPKTIFKNKLEEIRKSVSEITIDGYPDVKCSVAIGGVFGIQPIEKALAEADKLMYLDKHAKRDFL